jgi:hypothetical protein
MDMFICVLKRSVLAVSVMYALGTSSPAFGDGGSVESSSLATDPCPVVSGIRDSTNAELVSIRKHLQDGNDNDVFQVVGHPDSIDHVFGGHFQWTYQLRRSRLIINLENGRVTGDIRINVEEQERQTGVREDDFVGVIGP